MEYIDGMLCILIKEPHILTPPSSLPLFGNWNPVAEFCIPHQVPLNHGSRERVVCTFLLIICPIFQYFVGKLTVYGISSPAGDRKLLTWYSIGIPVFHHKPFKLSFWYLTEILTVWRVSETPKNPHGILKYHYIS